MRRSGWLLALLLIGVVLLPACGSDADPQEVVAASGDATIEAGSAKVHEVIETTGGPAEGRATAEGAFDFRARTGSLTMHAQGQEVEMVLDGSDIYQRIPGLEDETGTNWLHMDFDSLGEAAGVEGLSSLLESTSNDPSTQLGYLRGAGQVKERGTAKVRGASTTKYHAVIDYDEVAKGGSKDQAKALRQLVKLMGTHEQPLDVWIDGDGRTRRLVQSIDFSKVHLPDGADASQLPEEMTITLEYDDFGTKVDVELPDDDDVTELSDLIGGEDAPVEATPAHVVLERSLLADVPAGFEQQADDVGDTGPSDLAKAVRDAGEDDAEQLLTDAGFVAGYQRLWVKGDDESELIVFLYEFETPAGAASYGEHYQAVEQATEDGTTASPFPVVGVPGAIGTTYADDDGWEAHMVDFVHGTYVVRVAANGPSSSSELAVALARQQLQRLSQ